MFGIFRKKKEQSSEVLELLSEYSKWADAVQTPAAMTDLLDSLNETCHAIFGTGLRMTISESDFSRMSLSTARTMVRDAIESLKDYISERNL